jgi:hypothetical protein
MSKTDEWNHPPITTLENRKMPGPQFFQTRMGQKFYGSDVPRIAEALEEIGKEMKKTNELKKKELEPEEPLHTVLNDEELKQTRALARLQLRLSAVAAGSSTLPCTGRCTAAITVACSSVKSVRQSTSGRAGKTTTGSTTRNTWCQEERTDGVLDNDPL